MSADPDTTHVPYFGLHDIYPNISEKFCASLANGNGRCKKGTCYLTRPDEPPPELAEVLTGDCQEQES